MLLSWLSHGSDVALLPRNTEHDLYLLERLNLITSEKILEKACDLLSKPFLSLLGSKEVLEKLSDIWSLY